MKHALSVLVVVISVMSAAFAFADQYDAKWISECIKDNQSAKVAVEVIVKYCTCMNNKMDSNESRSITQWEKTHPKERTECDAEAGWK